MSGRRFSVVVLGALLVISIAGADLQNVEVGGKLEIYGVWYSDFFEPDGASIRFPAEQLPFRAVGPYGAESAIRAGGGGNSNTFVEQRTRLHLTADFTSNVLGYLEFDSIDTWGEDFRSNYLTGVDSRADTQDDIELYQGFIEGQEVLGLPVRFRIGRQELEFGSGWLVGADPGPDPFVGLSFDGVRLTFEHDEISFDVWWAKVAESGTLEEDGDTDFYGVYATYKETGGSVLPEGPEHAGELLFLPERLIYKTFRLGPSLQKGVSGEDESVEFDVYWMFLRDAAARGDTYSGYFGECMEDFFEMDDYDVTNLHTVGFRGAGSWGAVDWEAEVAYQWGSADAVGALFIPNGGIYGDDDAKWNNWAGHAEFGYQSNLTWSPRVYVGGAYYGGEDNREFSWVNWVCPYAPAQSSVSFNRLFSSWREDAFLDASALSNFWKAYAGITAGPTEKVEVGLSVVYLASIEPFDYPPYINIGKWGSGRFPIAPELPFWTKEADKDLGWETVFYATYQYSEDLSFEFGWAHFFIGDGLEQGAFLDSHGLYFVSSRGTDDADTIYWMTTLEF